MENQHRVIKGYRELSQAEIDLMNQVKSKANEIGELIGKLQATDGVDKRWLSIGTTDIQKGVMAIVRSIAQPGGF